MEEYLRKTVENFLEVDKIFIRNLEKLMNIQEKCVERLEGLKNSVEIEETIKISETIVRNHIRFVEVSKGIIEKLKSINKSYDNFDEIKKKMIKEIIGHELLIKNIEFLIEKINELEFDLKYGNVITADDFIRAIGKQRQN